MNLTLEERTKVFDKVCRLVETKHLNPSMNGVDWNALVKNRRDPILASAEPETFEKEVQSLVAALLRQYGDAGNEDRLFGEDMNVLEAEGYDFELAGAA